MAFADVQRLRAFALVLDLGSISAAASVLGYTQSAVSQQLAALEREVGMPLVERSQRPLRSTRAGALLRPHVDRVLAALGGAELAVEVLQAEPHEAVERLRGGEADLAVIDQMPGVAIPETGGLQRRRLLVDHLHVVLPDGHRLARRDSVKLSDLEGEPLILPRRDTPVTRFRSVIEHLCAQGGFEPRVAYELDDLPAIHAFIAAGIAIAPVHGLILATLRPGATARPLAERPAGSRTIEALAPAAARTPVVDELLDRLADAARAYTSKR